MAEVKTTEQIKVLAGTFPAAHGDQARKLKEALKAVSYTHLTLPTKA